MKNKQLFYYSSFKGKNYWIPFSIAHNEKEKRIIEIFKNKKNFEKRIKELKARMLKAGLENKGLIMPEDWDSLPDETKLELHKKLTKLGL